MEIPPIYDGYVGNHLTERFGAVQPTKTSAQDYHMGSLLHTLRLCVDSLCVFAFKQNVAAAHTLRSRRGTMATRKTSRPASAEKPASDWRRFATETGNALQERLQKLGSLSAEERDKLSQRFQEAVSNALEVPPQLREVIEERAARLIAQSDTVDPVSIAWDRTRERARRTAAIGAVTTMPALVPGVGTALAALGLVADWRYVAEQQRDLVLEIAALFGEWPEDPTKEARNLFLAATATAFAAPSTGKVVTEILARQIARRGVARLLPGAGAAVAGALNYISTIALGRAAIEEFGLRNGFEVHGIIPAESHPALPWLRNSVVQAVEAGAVGDLSSDEAKKSIAKLSPTERDELLDLAAALTLARDRDPVGDPLMDQLGTLLGFAPDQVEKAMNDAIRSAMPMRKRLGAALREIGSRGSGAVEKAWDRAAQLVRRRKRGPARKSKSRNRKS